MTDEQTQLGKYTLLEVLGEGASARVYRAIHAGPMGFRKQVAVKQILPHVLQNDSAIRGLINEARLGGFLHHRNLVEIYEFDQAGDTFYIAMEFVPGHSLADALQRTRGQGPLPTDVIAEIAVQLCDGLAYAHAARDESGQPLNLIHRDLKPGNVMITPYGAVKIMDFGVAKSAANLYHTQAANITRGTPAYMSPEQVTGKKLDHRSDLFALGSMLTELITGSVLFFDTNLHMVLKRVYRADIRAAMDQVTDRIPQMVPVLRHLLQRDRDKRFATADDVGRAVRGACADLLGQQDLGRWLVQWMTAEKSPTVDADEMPTVVAHRIEPEALEAVVDDSATRRREPPIFLELDPEPPAAPPPVSHASGGYCEETLLTAQVTSTVTIPGGDVEDPLMDIFLARVEPCTAWMGSRADAPDAAADEFLHRVRLTRPFLIAATPVTQAQWMALMHENPAWAKGDELPVESVSWYDAVLFCNRLSEALGLRPAYDASGSELRFDLDAPGFRLPTEAEWETSARAGKSHLYAGSSDVDTVAWYWGNTGGLTQPVGRKKPNEVGLYDMSGNVAEWVWDLYGPYSTESESTDPTGAEEGEIRACRGGSAFNLPADLRVTARCAQVRPDERYHFLGFRLARTAIE